MPFRNADNGRAALSPAFFAPASERITVKMLQSGGKSFSV